jgi:hypothetical protein
MHLRLDADADQAAAEDRHSPQRRGIIPASPDRTGDNVLPRAARKGGLWFYRDSTHCGPWFLTLLIVVLMGRAVIRSESNGTSGISSPASHPS